MDTRETEGLLLNGDAKCHKTSYTKKQVKILIIFSFMNICSGMCYSIQAPFYPAEAEKKGMSESVYGLVFGVFELVDFIACPIYGRFIRHIGPKFMFNAGNFVMAVCCLLFGFLDKAAAGTPFMVLSFAVRIVEALGQAGFITACYAIVAYEFPENIAQVFSILETFFSVGFIIGPTIGGFLFEFSGFLLPFAVNGTILLIASIMSLFILPEMKEARSRNLSILKLLKIPSIAICYYTVAAVSFSLGFTLTVLEPQLRQFNLPPSIIGLIFVVPGLSYCVTAIIWGKLADKYMDPMLMCCLGGILISIAFLFMGPASFLPIEPHLWLEIIALTVHGIGVGAVYISAFIDSNKQALLHGFPDDLETYGLIAGLWSSGFALGNFIGPSVSGVMNENLGFRKSTIIVLAQQILVSILSFGAYFWRKRKLAANNITSNNFSE